MSETLTRDGVKEFLGLPEQALRYYVETGRLTPDDAGMFDADEAKAFQAGMRLFGISTAAAYLGMSVQNLKYHVHVGGNIQPIRVGKSLVFSKEQLDDFAANGRTSIVPQLGNLYSATDAAEYLGLSPAGFGWHARQRHIVGYMIGRSILYDQAELDRFEGEDTMRPQT